MKTLRKKQDLYDYLDGEFAWRLKEISDIKSAIRKSEPTQERSFLRAGVPILYAHWEGFIKIASEAFLHFLNNQRLKLIQLRPCYIVFGAKKHLHELATSGNADHLVGVVEFFLNEMNSRASLKVDGAIKTGWNLSSTHFEQIATSLGINTDPYSTRYNMIDQSLLDRRNKVAHGERLDIDAEVFNSLSENVISLMRHYKTDIENIVKTGSYQVT